MKKYLPLLLLPLYFFWHIPSVPTHYETTPALIANQLNQDFQLLYIDAIQNAQQSVVLLVYSLKDPKIIAALNKKSAEGVSVTVVTDAKASKGIRDKLSSHIALTERFFKGLMHLKLLAVDDSKVFIGSTNMTTDSLKRHANLVLALNHPGLADMITRKAATLGSAERVSLLAHERFSTPQQTLDFWFFPDNKTGPDQLKTLIRSAKKSIRVAMYTWTRMDLAHELMFAKQRGVDVQVAIDKSAAAAVSKKVVSYLEKAHIRVKQNVGKALLHHKFLVIDDETLVLGSANWTKAAFETNDDCFLILKPLTPLQQQVLDQLWEVITDF